MSGGLYPSASSNDEERIPVSAFNNRREKPPCQKQGRYPAHPHPSKEPYLMEELITFAVVLCLSSWYLMPVSPYLSHPRLRLTNSSHVSLFSVAMPDNPGDFEFVSWMSWCISISNFLQSKVPPHHPPHLPVGMDLLSANPSSLPQPLRSASTALILRLLGACWKPLSPAHSSIRWKASWGALI